MVLRDATSIMIQRKTSWLVVWKYQTTGSTLVFLDMEWNTRRMILQWNRWEFILSIANIPREGSIMLEHPKGIFIIFGCIVGVWRSMPMELSPLCTQIMRKTAYLCVAESLWVIWRNGMVRVDSAAQYRLVPVGTLLRSTLGQWWEYFSKSGIRITWP